MKLSRSNAAVVKRALNQWVEEGELQDEQAQKLDKSIEIQKFDWQGLSSYAFYGALMCFVVAIAAIFTGNFFYKLVQHLLSAPDSIYALAFSAFSVALFIWGMRFRKNVMRTNTEVMLVITITLWGIALFFWNKAFGWSDSMLAFILLIWALPTFAISVVFRSVLQWCLALVALFFALLFLFDLLASSQIIFQHFNYFLRAAFCSILILLGSLSINKIRGFLSFYPITYGFALVALMVSLWFVSISGNSQGYDEWRAISHWHFWPWIVLFTAAGVAALWRGLQSDNDMLKGIGVSALLLDVYTRYFEFFWDTLHKALFFMFLAASLWFVSRQAEQIARKNKQKSDKFLKFNLKHFFVNKENSEDKN